MIGSRQGGVDSQFADLKFIPQTVAPATDSGADQMYQGPNGFCLKDKAGIESPIALGADGAGVVSKTAAYVGVATDRVILADTTAAPWAYTLPPVANINKGISIRVVDKARQFGTNALTVNTGDGSTINGAASVVLNVTDTDTVFTCTGTAWERNAAGGSNSVTGTQLSAGAIRVLTSVGHNNVGAVTLTGAKVGDTVIGISNVTDHATLLPTTDFEATISVLNQIQQVNVSDLSAKTLIFFLVAKS